MLEGPKWLGVIWMNQRMSHVEKAQGAVIVIQLVRAGRLRS